MATAGTKDLARARENEAVPIIFSLGWWLQPELKIFRLEPPTETKDVFRPGLWLAPGLKIQHYI